MKDIDIKTMKAPRFIVLYLSYLDMNKAKKISSLKIIKKVPIYIVTILAMRKAIEDLIERNNVIKIITFVQIKNDCF